MLRIDPAHPPLWRDPTTLQFGLHAVAVLEVSDAWQERLVRELEHGVPPAALDGVGRAVGAPTGAAAQFVRRISRALAPAAPVAPRGIAIQAADGVSDALVDDVRAALSEAGFEPSADSAGADPVPVVMLAHHVVHPRSASMLLGRDISHLPIVFSGAGAEVGPFVRPGVTPCLSCVAEHRRDADEAWPRLAAQLLGRRAPVVSTALAWEAGLAASHMITDAARHPARQTASSLQMRAESGARTVKTHRPHAACRCRSLGGIATGRVPGVPATTRATAYAQPA
jgi:hypothetical protein